MSSRSSWLTAMIGAAAALLIAGATMIVTSQNKISLGFEIGVVLVVLALALVVWIAFLWKRAANQEAIDAMQTRFEEIPIGMSVVLVFEDGQFSRATVAGPVDYLIEKAFESACARAVKTIKNICRVRRLFGRRLFPGQIWQHPDAVSTWIAILLDLKLKEPSFGETLWPYMRPGPMSHLPNVRAASIEACQRIRDRL